MNKINVSKSASATVVFRTVTTGATSVLLMQLIGLNISLNSRFPYTSINLGSRAEASANPAPEIQPLLRYNPPLRGAPRSTQGTGSRGAFGYTAPNRGTPRSTQGTGSRGDVMYRAPKRGAPESTQGTGSRGNLEELPITLTLLIPNDHTGRTTSGHPSFFWYMSEAPEFPAEFALVEPGQTKPLFVQQIATPKAGMIQVEMPKDLPELVVGRKYRWSVSLIRNSKRRSNDVFVQGWIERMPTTPELTKQLATATSKEQQAAVYAKAGLWYDALATISQAQAEKPTDKSILEERLSLLEQVGQTQVVKQERQRVTSN